MIQPVWSVHSPTARTPIRLDEVRFLFRSDQDVTIPPNGVSTVSTGIGFTMPNNVGALVYPVSRLYSLHFPRFMKTTNGTALDIKIFNFSNDSPLVIEAGQDLIRMLSQRPVNVQHFPFMRLNVNAIIPIRHPDSTGWVLKSPIATTIPPNSSEIIDTGISTPGVQGYNAYVYPLHEFCISNYMVETMDSLHIRLMNCSGDPLNVEVGDELGLVTLNDAVPFEVVEVEVQELPARMPLSPINRRG